MTNLRSGTTPFAALLLATVVGACAPAPSGPASLQPTASASSPVASPAASQGAVATFEPSLGRNEAWRADLAKLVPGMDAIHPNLTHGTSRADLDTAVAALSATVDTATDDQLMVGVLRVVAMVSKAGCDGHTGAFVWGAGTYPVDSLPLRLWLFDDEVVVVDALPPYIRLIGARIDTIEGHPIADVMAAIDPLVPRDNAQTVRLLMPRFLLIPQILRGLGLADDGSISLAVTAVDGTTSTIDVNPIAMAAYNGWAGPYGLHLPADPSVRYLSRIGDALWWEMLPDGETLYVQYNRVDHLPATLLDSLRTALHEPDVARIVLDIRHNYGGELTALDPIVAIFEDPAVDQHDRLFVFIGRDTFSAGSLLVARLDRDTGAVIVGEAMGGCPTIWSDPSDLVLTASGIVVGVADDVAIGVAADDPRLTIEPDIAAVLTREEWADGRDPALAVVVGSAP